VLTMEAPRFVLARHTISLEPAVISGLLWFAAMTVKKQSH
jgi:hypothetical protein